MNNATIIERLDKLHSEGLRTLSSYRQEIMIMEGRLAEVSVANHSPEARQAIDRFQNQFTLQQNNIDELRCWINEHTQQVGREAILNDGRIQSMRVEEQDILTKEYKRVEKLILQLSKEFNQFLVRWNMSN